VSENVARRLGDLPIAVVVYDKTGRVSEANDAACDVLGISREGLVGSWAEDAGWLVTEGAAGPVVDNAHPVMAALGTGLPQLAVLVMARRTDRSQVWLQVDAVPALTAKGEVEHVVASLTDVTRILSHSRLTERGVGDHILAEVTGQLANTQLDPQAILSSVTSTLSKLRRGTWIASLMNKDPATVRMFAADGDDREVTAYVERMQRSGEVHTTSIAMKVIETGKPLFNPNLPAEELSALLSPDARDYLRKNPWGAPEARYYGLLVVPMRARGAVIGTIGVYEARSSSPLTEKDVDWLQQVADRTGLAVDNAQLYEDAVNRLERLDSLRSVGLAITASPDLRLTLRVILDQVKDRLGVDSADVLLVDEVDGMLAVAASAGFRSTSIPDYRLPVDEGLPGRALKGRRIETVTALSAFSQFRRRSLFAREGFKAYGAVPLIARGKLLGVLEVFHRTPLEPDQEWVAFLDALASDAAIAIDNAAMYETLQKVGPTGPPRQPAGTAPELSRVEKEILALVVEGATNSQIAERVHLSQNTVKFHVHRLLQKADAVTRTELAHKATRERWL
jgi:GAF domain-containing protein/DNA-binding CsgD family transcriptional regulator